MAIICNIFLVLGVGFFGAILLRMSRLGLLNDVSNAAPPDTISKLEKVTNFVESESSCSICLEDFTTSAGMDNEVVRTPCMHLFHAKCLEQWFKCGKTVSSEEARR